MSRDQLIFTEMFKDQVYGPRDGLIPRDWQLDCLDVYKKFIVEVRPEPPRTFCLYAGTGSGKTKACGLMASFMLNNAYAEQIIVVCPSRCIRAKTKKDFLNYFGIDLVPFNKRKHSNGIPRMKQGYILTYAALMNDPTLHRRICQATKTLVIFDEIHHLGDSNGWGDGAMEAFGKVAYVIALTGTPYRSDNTRIPFVRYDLTETNGLLRFMASEPDGFTYSLGRAVADGHCRKPHFIFHDGTINIRYVGSGTRTVTFEDQQVNQKIASDRLRGAVCYGSTDRKELLRTALTRCRQEHRKVVIFLGGDTVGDYIPTQDATEHLPTELEELGYSPEEFAVVTSDHLEAQTTIEKFGAHPKQWILVSVNMISEGTDIPELSASIFLTSITAKQTTLQRIGRALRLLSEDDPHKDALIFMFKDKALWELRLEIDKEVEQEVSLRKKRESIDGGGDRERGIRAEAIGVGLGRPVTVAFGGQDWPYEIVEKARRQLAERGLPATMMHAALTLMGVGKQQ